MQPAKPAFLEYFEQKEKEANIQNNGGGRGENNAYNRKLPTKEDVQMVSWTHFSPKENVHNKKRSEQLKMLTHHSTVYHITCF